MVPLTIRHASFVTLASAMLCALLLSGCTAGGGTASIAGQGVMGGTETRSLSCGTEGHLALGVQGGGSLTVTVTDGTGAQIYQKSVGSGQNGESVPLHGQAGTWNLKVSGSGYSGQYGITLSC